MNAQTEIKPTNEQRIERLRAQIKGFEDRYTNEGWGNQASLGYEVRRLEGEIKVIEREMRLERIEDALLTAEALIEDIVSMEKAGRATGLKPGHPARLLRNNKAAMVALEELRA